MTICPHAVKTFSFLRQYSWMHSSETRSVMWLLCVLRAACKPRQADTIVRLNRKTNVLCLHRSVWQCKNVNVSRRFLADHQHQRTSVRCSETFGGTQTRSLSDVVSKTLVLGILLLRHVSAHAVRAAAAVFCTFVSFVVCVLGSTASETVFFLVHRRHTG